MDPVGSAGRPTAVVLGASGFVGRNVCAALRDAGRPVAAVARRAGGLPEGCRPVALDIARGDPAALAAELAALRPDVVVNAAGALWNVTDDELTAGNVTLVERLVRAVEVLPGPVRLVHIGSAYEYGVHPDEKLVETLPARPVGRYAQTKLAGTQVVTRAAAEGRVTATVLRIPIALGPFTPGDSLLGGLARQLAAHPAEVRLPPLDGVRRELVDVRDVADAVLCAAHAARLPPVVNIGSGGLVRLTDTVDALLRIAGPNAAGPTIVRGPAAAVRRDAGAGDRPLDTGLARREFGWAPTRTVTDALHALWDSLRVPDPTPRHHT
ncbi:NAD-dependent epimerase/dehydratase family protein [Streptomyces sp. NBC_00316]|uniref:NAD-dependent epimerase/dehydratase family protein n=1 Tax=Streptomyces sp. NBC_00316 TaxID=2975710 RepID=UPI002E2921C5|nr:NAD-dependent epimerase/dehydratase family protein [Streptomyces sp. NBC_00316]